MFYTIYWVCIQGLCDWSYASVFKYYFSNTWTGLGCSGVSLCSLGVKIELSPYRSFWCLKAKHQLWQFLRYQWFNKQYYSGYLLIYLISWPLLIALKHDWYWLKGLFKGFCVPLRLWELLKNWWRYGQIKLVIQWLLYGEGTASNLLGHSSHTRRRH